MPVRTINFSHFTGYEWRLYKQWKSLVESGICDYRNPEGEFSYRKHNELLCLAKDCWRNDRVGQTFDPLDPPWSEQDYLGHWCEFCDKFHDRVRYFYREETGQYSTIVARFASRS